MESMYLVLDDIVSDELGDYLLSQEGIKKVEISKEKIGNKIYVEYDTSISPIIIMNYIALFEEYECSELLEFDKGLQCKIKKIKYTIESICCEYCYKSFVMELFKNKYIHAFKSNFDFDRFTSIIIEVEYTNYSEDEIVEIIKKNI